MVQSKPVIELDYLRAHNVRAHPDLELGGPHCDSIGQVLGSNSTFSQHSKTPESLRRSYEPDTRPAESSPQPDARLVGMMKTLSGKLIPQDPIYIHFEPDDPENPMNWPKRKKVLTTWVTTFMTFTVSIVNGGYASAQPGIEQAFNVPPLLATLGLSLFILGFAIAPLLLAPLSEVYGRTPVYVSSFFLFWIFILPQALAQNIETVLITKFISGFFASTGSTMVGGTLADIWNTKDRGPYMNIFVLLAFSATFLGPVFLGVTAQEAGFRWSFWVCFILSGVYFLVLVLTLSETRGSVILSRRAAKMRKDTGNPRYITETDAERESLITLIRVSLTRPIYLLFTEPIVSFFSIWIAMAWAVFYMLLESTPLVLQNNHGFDLAQTGYSYSGPVIASIVAAALNSIQDRLYDRATIRNGGVALPEARLYSSMVGTILFTAGIFLYGWTSGPRFHWILPVLGSSIAVFGIYTIYSATFNYLADAYRQYASSAIAGQSFARNILGFAFPLFTKQMFQNLGYDYAATVVGCCAAVLSIVPFLLFYFGARIRKNSKFAGAVAGES